MNPTPEQKRTLRHLRLITDKRRRRQAHLDGLTSELRAAIRKAVDAGIPKVWIAEATGLARETIYKAVREEQG